MDTAPGLLRLSGGFSRELNSFVQYYGSKELDASLLLLPLVGCLPPEDPRIQGTMAAIEKTLMQDGLVARYNTKSSVDGLVGNEGAFLACSFWMVDNTSSKAESRKRVRFSSTCFRCATMSAFWRKNTTPKNNASWEIFRRRSLILRLSTVLTTSALAPKPERPTTVPN
jgi:GH15 family glucan-1,4-alpha-glucosidase